MLEQTFNGNCKQCGAFVSGAFCSNCGQPYPTKKLTISSILHEIFHFFTHLEHGFPYTLQKLFTQPGIMQRQYIEGQRGKHQKPFSMFFLCATIAALIYYWVNLIIVKQYHAGSAAEVSFFHQYMVISQVTLVPVYAFITYLFFARSGYNYAEVLVQFLYTFSLLLIIVAMVQLLKFIWPHLQTRYVELPLVLIYTVITSVHFFEKLPTFSIAVKSVFATTICFILAGFVQDLLIKMLH